MVDQLLIDLIEIIIISTLVISFFFGWLAGDRA